MIWNILIGRQTDTVFFTALNGRKENSFKSNKINHEKGFQTFLSISHDSPQITFPVSPFNINR